MSVGLEMGRNCKFYSNLIVQLMDDYIPLFHSYMPHVTF